jgi:hypothetical protein
MSIVWAQRTTPSRRVCQYPALCGDVSPYLEQRYLLAGLPPFWASFGKIIGGEKTAG